MEAEEEAEKDLPLDTMDETRAFLRDHARRLEERARDDVSRELPFYYLMCFFQQERLLPAGFDYFSLKSMEPMI